MLENEQIVSHVPRRTSNEGLEDTSSIAGTAGKPSNKNDLQDFKNINSSLMQDALRVWSDLWAELDSSRGVAGILPANRGRDAATVREHGEDALDTRNDEPRAMFPEPSCEFSEFVKKMWILRSYLDFAKRISR